LTAANPLTAVILMAYGSPERPEDIPAYFSDIRGGRPVRPEAVDELVERYRRIGGTSPLNRITEAQRAGLEEATGLPVYVGMKHWEPWIAEAVEQALADAPSGLSGRARAALLPA
jgi:ferrochelatase